MATKAYEEDLAYIHDEGHTIFAHGTAPEILKILASHGIDSGRVVDLGCGSGVWAKYLTDSGYEVTGIDISPAMIELARKKAPRADFQVGSFLDVAIPPCRAVTALSEVFNYLFDEQNNLTALQAVLERIYQALEPGGLLLFDITEVGLDRDRPPTFTEGKDWACLVRFEHDAATERLTRHITSFRQVGELYRRGEETHTVQLYNPEEVKKLLEANGFKVQMQPNYGNYPLAHQRMAFLSKKQITT